MTHGKCNKSLHLSVPYGPYLIKCHFFPLTSYSLFPGVLNAFLIDYQYTVWHLCMKGVYDVDFRLTTSLRCVCGYYPLNTGLGWKCLILN